MVVKSGGCRRGFITTMTQAGSFDLCNQSTSASSVSCFRLWLPKALHSTWWCRGFTHRLELQREEESITACWNGDLVKHSFNYALAVQLWNQTIWPWHTIAHWYISCLMLVKLWIYVEKVALLRPTVHVNYEDEPITSTLLSTSRLQINTRYYKDILT